MLPFAKATRALVRRLGPALVDISKEGRWAASFDSSKLSFLPEAVVTPRRREDIAPVLELANAQGVPVTVRGRGTTLMGSAAPVAGGWVIDMLRLNKIRIDSEAGMAHVQVGALNAEVQRAAAEAGWFYPPDPASKAYCTIGGNIACNAGGMHGGKYGVTRDFVIALSGYLPTGEWVQWGTATRKFSAGFNLRDLWIGSEGMLGVVTDAVLRLVPAPAARWTLLTAFASEVEAVEAVRMLFREERVQPAICEFLDRDSVHCAESATGRPVFAGQRNRVMVLFELAGSASEVREESKKLVAWAKAHAVAQRVAKNREEAEQLWEVRRKCSGAMFELGNSKLNEDIVVPMRAYSRFMRFLAQLKKSSRLHIPTFGHLADGNLHVNIMFNREDADQARRAEAAVERLMRKVVELGGAISGEHGIGLAKTPFLRIQHSPAQVRAMQAVKAALDPRGILNPGKLFDVFEVWKQEKLNLKLPWDHK